MKEWNRSALATVKPSFRLVALCVGQVPWQRDGGFVPSKLPFCLVAGWWCRACQRGLAEGGRPGALVPRGVSDRLCAEGW